MLLQDIECGKPSLLPGDIVKSKRTGTPHVIEQAGVIVNGGRVNWNEDLPKKIEHGWRPSYAAQHFPGYPEEQYAWWDLEEFEVIALGPLHDLL